MAKYKVLKKSYINNRIVEEGEIVEFSGEASPDNLQLIKEETAKKSKAQPKVAEDDESKQSE